MSETQSRQLILKSRPQHNVDDSTFAIETNEIPEISENQVRVQVITVEIMPCYRIFVEVDAFDPKVPLGEVMRASGIGRVMSSNSPNFAEGDLVAGMLGA